MKMLNIVTSKVMIQVSGCELQVLPFVPNLTARFAQDAKVAKEDLFLSNRVTASIKGATGRLRFDKTFNPAGNQIHPNCD
jgi:hypothetical protein